MCLGPDRRTLRFSLRRATLGPFRRRGGTRGLTCLQRDTAASSRSSCGVGHRRAPDAWTTRHTWMRRSARRCDRRTVSPRSRSRGSASRHRPRGRTAQAHEQRLRGPLDPPRTAEAATQRILEAECSGQRKMSSDCPDPRRALPGSNSPSEGASRRCACRLPSVACRRLAREVDDAPIGVARIVFSTVPRGRLLDARSPTDLSWVQSTTRASLGMHFRLSRCARPTPHASDEPFAPRQESRAGAALAAILDCARFWLFFSLFRAASIWHRGRIRTRLPSGLLRCS